MMLKTPDQGFNILLAFFTWATQASAINASTTETLSNMQSLQISTPFFTS